MRLIIFALASIVMLSASLIHAEDKPSQEELEKKFTATLTGATLVGFHTDSNKKPGELTEERYAISSVSKLKDDTWLFKARIAYGKHDITVPLTLQVKWAGDTPVITLTDFTVPLMGKFSARVVIYDDAYAGTWSGAKHGGHLFGKIVRPKPKPTLRIELDADGLAHIGDKKYPLEELERALRASSKKELMKETVVVIVADGKAKHGKVQDVIMICQDAGYQHFALRAKKSDEPSKESAKDPAQPAP